ncbi:hypothetical protein M419DRAFT_120015 [Trichoderma reesei RUT C-30]|uniref:Uncharacterized protein n=1 Tax=Hypocrea jecorina (strain ATCC 56765 / BCRC 32924 / NRRL 11460 / Rut C-30) TaxID=1344414 RepID=A0A024S3J4_HYPJR|nr:hypothetical protein M419DRAFT_120015 [Trichoderma reesei RUT C-30]
MAFSAVYMLQQAITDSLWVPPVRVRQGHVKPRINQATSGGVVNTSAGQQSSERTLTTSSSFVEPDMHRNFTSCFKQKSYEGCLSDKEPRE